MPADGAFFFLLLGSTLLFISNSLGWWYAWERACALGSCGIQATQANQRALAALAQALTLASFPIAVAGAAGFFVCFFPGKNPLRRFAWWVYLPAVIGLVLTTVCVLTIASATHAAVAPWGEGKLFRFVGISSLFLNAGSGLHFALIGLLCIEAGVWRIRRGLATLPIHLNASTNEADDTRLTNRNQSDWKRFVWVGIALLNQLSIVVGALVSFTFVFGLSLLRFSFFRTNFYPNLLARTASALIPPAVFLALVLVAVGKNWRQVLRDSLRLPLPEYFAVALFIPIAIYSMSLALLRVVGLHFSDFALNRIFSVHPTFDFLLLTFLLALVEEIAWRGYLQRRFIAEFGTYRGIFFVGMVWAAFHFSGDFRPDQTDFGALRFLAGRLAGGIIIGFALSWLSLRSRSILPAALTHAAINAIDKTTSLETPFALLLILWVLADFLLFRLWSPNELASCS